MDEDAFSTHFADIVDLNNSEGPHYNVFEPKFEARKQLQQLIETVVNVYKGHHSWLALRQLCRCLVLIGTIMMEVDEEEEGVVEVRRAYALLQLCAAEVDDGFPEDPAAVPPTPLEDVIAAAKPLLDAGRGYAAAVEYLRVHNAMGLYLSKQDTEQRVGNAKVVLLRAEEAYRAWGAWFSALPAAPTTAQLTVADNGRLVAAELAEDPEQRRRQVLRFEMDTAYTSTLFFLAQVYASLGESTPASKYCHLTMFYQLLCKQEYDRKVWACNALQLGGFYSSHLAYGRAMHCLRAGEQMMSQEPATEATAGQVAWAYGRFHLHRLAHYGNERTAALPPVGPEKDEFARYWVDFPIEGVEPATEMRGIATFDDARDAFKQGNAALQEALGYHPFESACTSHIEIVQDISQLYGALDLFEDDRGRRIAMLQRRIGLLDKFPDQLNFNAYPVVVRQLLYDLGYLYEDVIRLRQEQRRGSAVGGGGEKPLKDKPFNALVTTAKGYYTRFVETWRSPTTGELPDVLEEDSRLPFFRALMRLAHTEMCFAFPSYKDEYDGIGRTRDAYQRAVDFVERNQPITRTNEDLIEREVALARDMIRLLPNKQREVWVAYQRSLQQ